MIVELLGHGKRAYYIDPNGINHQWFYGIKNLDEYKIKSYNQLKRVVLNSNKIPKKVLSENKRHYCLNSRNTTEFISKFFKNETFKD